MIVRLEKRDGRAIYLNTRSVLLTEETATGFHVTVEALALSPIGGPSSNVRSSSVVHRVLDLDHVGAAPLIIYLDQCVKNLSNP
jgi:hypothetical protein